MLRSLDQLMERKEGGDMYLLWVPLIGDVRTLMMDEAHASRYLVHSGADKMYYDLRDMYGGHLKIPEWKYDIITMDFTTRLPRSSSGYDTNWLIVDRLTKAEIEEIQSIGPELVQETTNKVILIKEKLRADEISLKRGYCDNCALSRSLTGKDTSWDIVRLPILWGIVHSANLDFASLIWDEFEWQAIDKPTKPSKMSKLMYYRFTKLIIDHFLSCNESIPRRFDSVMHSEGQDLPLTKLTNTVKGTYRFGIGIPDIMIDDAFKKSAGYKYYKAKKAESEKAKAFEEPEEHHESPVRSGKGKGYMRLGDQEANVLSVFKKNDVLKKPISLTTADNIVEEQAAVELAKSLSIEEQLHQQRQAVAGEGSSAVHNKYYEFENISATDSDATQDSSRSDTDEEKDVEIDDSDDSDMDLSEDEPKGDDDDAGYKVFIMLNETPTNELMNFMSHPVYTDAQITSAEMFLDKATHHLSSPPANTTSYPIPHPQQNSLQAKAKKLMKKAKKNMRKINFKKAVAQKFKEYDQKLEALTNVIATEVIDKVVQAKFLTKMKKLQPTLIPKAVANYVKPKLKNMDPHNDREGENRKKRRTDAGEPSFRSSRKDKTPMVHDPKDTHKLKELLQKDVLTIADLEGARLEKLKQQYKNDMELEYHVDQLKAAVLSEAQWNSDEGDMSMPSSFERHMSKSTKPHPSFYNNNFYYLVYLSTKEKYTTSLTKHYASRTRQRLMWAVLTVPDISEGRPAYQGAAPSGFCGGEGGDRELVIVKEFVGELLGKRGDEGGRRWLCLQGSCMAIWYLLE
ncbi:hypothetical protein Tco_0875421 [Tanacetum coccineum]|uniref:Uncharacterized protein n=1 Tax=Tanacetum coccineum TaxID=301880 RepID=A0ABQ5BPK1_9ASTR